MSYMFFGAGSFAGGGIGNWDLSSCSDISYMFKDATSFDLDLGSWNIANVQTLRETFRGASGFTGSKVSMWDVSKVTDLYQTQVNRAAYHMCLSQEMVSNCS